MRSGRVQREHEPFPRLVHVVHAVDRDVDGSRAAWACTTRTRAGETARVCRLRADEDVDGSRAAWVCTTRTRAGETTRACRLRADEDVDGPRTAWACIARTRAGETVRTHCACR
jgi:hypothetical protein